MAELTKEQVIEFLGGDERYKVELADSFQPVRVIPVPVNHVLVTACLGFRNDIVAVNDHPCNLQSPRVV